MRLRSLGYRTDLIFSRFGGRVIDRGDYLVVLTPDNPGYRWGNFLLFAEPPREGDFARWRRLFAEEVGSPPEITHVVFGWDGVDGELGEVAPFREAGFRLEESVVLTAGQVRLPPKVNDEIEIRPLRKDWEWREATLTQIACRDPEEDLAGYTLFKERKMASYRHMAEAGLGGWFGAFWEGRLVADMGLFQDGDVARFQAVETHPDFRRRGICGTMVHWVARYGLTHMGAKTLVMIADPNYHAARIYESVGFRPSERQVGLEWWS
jgi:GNAT superfamily N-acetyltransferase